MRYYSIQNSVKIDQVTLSFPPSSNLFMNPRKLALNSLLFSNFVNFGCSIRVSCLALFCFFSLPSVQTYFFLSYGRGANIWRQTTQTEPEEAAAPHAHLMFGRKASTVRVGTSSAYVNE